MQHHFRHVARFALPIASIVVAGCGGGDSTGPDGPRPPANKPGVRAVAGAGITDTIDALPLQALIVEVRGTDGSLARGVVVRFEAQPPADTARRGVTAISVCPLSAASCNSLSSPGVDQAATATTDSTGRAKVQVRLGRIAGPATVALKVPEFAFVDSASFTVTPGNAVTMRALAPDTAIDVGKSARLAGRVLDRRGNVRNEVPAMSLGTGSVLSLDAASGTVTAREMGTQAVLLKWGSLSDSTVVRAVPAGRLVVWSSRDRQVSMINLNGSNKRIITSGISSDFGAFPRLDPTRTRLSMHNGSSTYGGPASVLVTVDTTGNGRSNQSLGFTTIFTSRPMADGSVLVVAGRAGSAGTSLWRVTAAGSVVLVAAIPQLSGLYGGADISADGGRVAFVSYETGPPELRVLTVATGAVMTVATSVESPRWSPQGDRIAFVSIAIYGAVGIVSAGGGDQRILATEPVSPGLSWSPDGQYLVGRSSGYSEGLRLFRVSDGKWIPLRYRIADYYYEDFFQPDWI